MEQAPTTDSVMSGIAAEMVKDTVDCGEPADVKDLTDLENTDGSETTLVQPPVANRDLKSIYISTKNIPPCRVGGHMRNAAIKYKKGNERRASINIRVSDAAVRWTTIFTEIMFKDILERALAKCVEGIVPGTATPKLTLGHLAGADMKGSLFTPYSIHFWSKEAVFRSYNPPVVYRRCIPKKSAESTEETSCCPQEEQTGDKKKSKAIEVAVEGYGPFNAYVKYMIDDIKATHVANGETVYSDIRIAEIVREQVSQIMIRFIEKVVLAILDGAEIIRNVNKKTTCITIQEDAIKQYFAYMYMMSDMRSVGIWVCKLIDINLEIARKRAEEQNAARQKKAAEKALTDQKTDPATDANSSATDANGSHNGTDAAHQEHEIDFGDDLTDVV